LDLNTKAVTREGRSWLTDGMITADPKVPEPELTSQGRIYRRATETDESFNPNTEGREPGFRITTTSMINAETNCRAPNLTKLLKK
jgi:hypothetical protein